MHLYVFCDAPFFFGVPSAEQSSSRSAGNTATEMTSSRKDKRWLKSVTDPDLVSFFEDSQFDAGEYAKGFFEQREASHAAKRWAEEGRREGERRRSCCP